MVDQRMGGRPRRGRPTRGNAPQDHYRGEDIPALRDPTPPQQTPVPAPVESVAAPTQQVPVMDDSQLTEAQIQERSRGTGKTLKLFDLQVLPVPEIVKMADSYGLQDLGALRKHELIFEILKANARLNGTMFGRGVLEILPDGFGFLRSPYYNYLPCPEDIYVSP